MKKKCILWITIFMMCLFCRTDGALLAASGSTVVSVSGASVNIGDSVKVTVKAQGPAGEKAVSTMTVSFDSAILKFVDCSATYGGGGNSVTATSDSFTVTLKAVAAGKSTISVSGSDGVVFDTNEELDSMAKSSTSVTVNNAAAEQPADNNTAQAKPTEQKSSQQVTAPVQTAATEEKKLSADNSLQSLVLSAGTLSPAFSGPVTKYTATVPNNVTSLAVTATPVNEKAVVESVTGNDALSVGANTVSIVVRAENGVTATYTIQVTREAEGQAAVTDPPAESEVTTETGESETESADSQASEPQAAETQTPETAAPGTEEGETEEPVDVELLSANMEYLQREYQELSEQYEKLRRSRLTIIIIFLFVTAILVMVIINLLLRGRFGGDDDDMENGRKKKTPRRQEAAERQKQEAAERDTQEAAERQQQGKAKRETQEAHGNFGVRKRQNACRREEEELTPEQQKEKARREWFSDDLEERRPRLRKRKSAEYDQEISSEASAFEDELKQKAEKETRAEQGEKIDFIDFNDL